MIAHLSALAVHLISLLAFLPVVHERAYATPQEISITPEITQHALLSLSLNHNPLDRGNRQTVMAEVIDSQYGQGIAGVNIKGTVTYASFLPIYEFNGRTDGSGNFSYSWTIDRDVEPGTFIVG